MHTVCFQRLFHPGEETSRDQRLRRQTGQLARAHGLLHQLALGSSHILTRARVTVVWTQIGGSLAKIEALFSDMAPEPQKGKPMPPGMINALLRVPKEATTCTPEDFIECFQRTFPFFHVLPAARLIACALRLPHVAMVSA